MVTDVVVMGGRISSGLRAGLLMFLVRARPVVDRVFVRAMLFGMVGGLIGWLAWGGDVWRLGGVLLLPIAWGLAGSRWAASLLMVSYYLAGARGLPGGSAVFFGDVAPGWWGWGFWAVVCGLLTVPFAVLWSAKVGQRGWRFVVALCLSVVPPLGLIGWINPLAVAGVLFPGMGWVGLGLVGGVFYFLVSRAWRWVGGLIVLAVLTNLYLVVRPVDAPVGWAGVDTQFSQLSSGGGGDAGEILAAMRRVEWVKEFARGVPAGGVRVLPETVLGSFGGVSAFALMQTEEDLAARGARVLVGAEIPLADGRFKNAVVVLGAREGEGKAAIQRVPVPVAMWRPWSREGTVADVFGHAGVVEVGGLRAGVLVCYEQLLMFSVLWTMVERPDVLVAVSNVWWARGTSIPGIQGQMVGVFGRLFGVGWVGARNG